MFSIIDNVSAVKEKSGRAHSDPFFTHKNYIVLFSSQFANCIIHTLVNTDMWFSRF